MDFQVRVAFSFVDWRGRFDAGAQGNMERIIESIEVAKERGAAVRVGPELEIPGYGCLDHFLEGEHYRVPVANACLIGSSRRYGVAFVGGTREYTLLRQDRGHPLRHRDVRSPCSPSAVGNSISRRPVMHKNVIYNCRVIVHNRQILLIRPKMWLANDGNYRELRYFTPWQKHRQWEDHYLPRIVKAVTGQVRMLTT
jgi:NAD+ synthase (glutamine-hydrolysing)